MVSPSSGEGESAPVVTLPAPDQLLSTLDLAQPAGSGPLPDNGSADPAVDSEPALEVEVPLGRRVVVVGDLLLPSESTPSSRALAGDVALTLDRWQGPGVVVICGNLFAVPCGGLDLCAEGVKAALAAHVELASAVRAFTARADCRLLILPGWRDTEVASDRGVAEVLTSHGAEVVPAVNLRLATAAGLRMVLVRPASPAPSAGSFVDTAPTEARPWLAGVDRLEDPSASGRFVTSRVLYRRLGRLFILVALLPVVVAVLLRMPIVFNGLRRLLGRAQGPNRAIMHAYSASWTSRLLFAAACTIVVLLVLGLALAIASRVAWTALGGGALPRPGRPNKGAPLDDSSPSSGLLINGHEALDEARRRIADGATGLVTGGSLRAELTHLDPGFYASPGGTTELVREHPGRVGLPPVFLHHRQSSWIELETGAELHVRLLLADVDLPSSTLLERLVTPDQVVKGYKPAADLHPSLVASWPHGSSWPPPPDVTADRVRVRRVRRLAAAAIFVAGLVDLLIAVTPPLRDRLHVLQAFFPLGVAQAAGALVALAGIGLTMLARGVLRGQRRSWTVAVALLTLTLVLHLLHGAELAGIGMTGLVLIFLFVERERFAATSDSGSLVTALLTLLVGAAVAIAASSIVVEVSWHVRHHALPAWPSVVGAATERLVGLNTVRLPDNIDDWMSPSLLAVGVGLALVALYLLTRPVVDRRLSASGQSAMRRGAELRARDIVRRHGTGTLDYFALRDDKHFFFHRDSLVAYAVYGGVCLVSPDPIGPRSEREHVWTAFRSFADHHGWGVGIMAAAEEWLPTYRDAGMRHIYIGDEAVVDVRTFSLQGGKMKGLRQAVNRVERYGYTVSFLDPAHIDAVTGASLVDLMGRNRRGEHERGFSMMLGRIFDPRDTGLLLTVVYGPDGAPAAMCQFVPSEAIEGYSLDLMRRDPGEHPNGLLDYALCSTIEHLRQRGARGLSMNFAAMRSTLEGETGDGLTQRVERWALRRLSGVLQIETLWRFNAKYEPSWLPRYIVWDSAEQFVPTVVQIMRAESLTEIPVIGRLFGGAGRHLPPAHAAAFGPAPPAEGTDRPSGANGVSAPQSQARP